MLTLRNSVLIDHFLLSCKIIGLFWLGKGVAQLNYQYRADSNDSLFCVTQPDWLSVQF